jgi:hypothetical protein
MRTADESASPYGVTGCLESLLPLRSSRSEPTLLALSFVAIFDFGLADS